MPRIEVHPSDDGWRTLRCDDEGGVSDEQAHEDRRAAIDAAYEVRNAEGVKPAIVLMRPDGSVYGEMAHDESKSVVGGQRVNVEPAGESGEVG